MLIGIDPILSPELLSILRAMGHGDEIVIADANFPAEGCARRLVRLDGVAAPRALQAILSVLPLDTFIDDPAKTMAVVGAPSTIPPVVAEFQTVIDQTADAPAKVAALDRFEFYERAKSAFAVVQTGERRLYGNIILTKGVLKPAEGA